MVGVKTPFIEYHQENQKVVRRLLNKFRLWSELDVLKSFYYWVRLHLPRCASFHVFPKSIIKIDRSAQISITKGRTMVNASWIGGRKRQFTSQLVLSPGSKLIINDAFALYQGASIYLGPSAEMIIHGRSFMNTGTIVNCFSRIEIGQDTVVGDDVRIQDSDNHRVYDSGLQKEMTKPIYIGNHCWIGKNALILKGVTIGDGAIVAAGAVVVRDVPPSCLVAGNPAKVIKENVEWS